MNLKLLLTYPFENWLRPVLFALVSFPVFMISSFIDIGLIQLIAGTVFILAFIFLFLSMIFLSYFPRSVCTPHCPYIGSVKRM